MGKYQGGTAVAPTPPASIIRHVAGFACPSSLSCQAALTAAFNPQSLPSTSELLPSAGNKSTRPPPKSQYRHTGPTTGTLARGCDAISRFCLVWRPSRGALLRLCLTPRARYAHPGLHVFRPFRGRTSEPRHTHAITRHARTLPHLAPEGTEKIARGERSEPRDSCHKSDRTPAGAPEELVRIDTLVCATGRCKGTRLCYIFRQELTFDPGGVSCRQSPKRS